MGTKEKNNLGIALVKRVCRVCAKKFDGEIIMNTILISGNAKEVEEMHGKTIGYLEEPCKECQELIKKGFVLIGVIKAKSNDNDPYRNGNIWVIKHEAAAKLLGEDFISKTKGYALIDANDAVKLNLPDVRLDV